MQEISFKAKPNLPLTCKGESLTQTYIPDFTCGKIIVVELKAVSALCDERRIRAHNYPKASGIKSGVLVNFDHFPKVEYERIVR